MQAAALEMLLMSKERLKARDFVDRFKLALVANDPSTWVDKLFSDFAKPTDKSQPDVQVEYLDEVSDEDLMDSGEWRFQRQLSPEEAEKVLAEMSANPSGSFGVDDMDDDEGWV